MQFSSRPVTVAPQGQIDLVQLSKRRWKNVPAACLDRDRDGVRYLAQSYMDTLIL